VSRRRQSLRVGVNNSRMNPTYFSLAAPTLALAVLLLQLPRRIANWQIRRTTLQFEVAGLEEAHRIAMAAIDRECDSRQRRAAEIAARNGITSAGLLGKSRSVIDAEFARKRSEALTARSDAVVARAALLRAGWFKHWFADACHRP
jgi:hypothetical protein